MSAFPGRYLKPELVEKETGGPYQVSVYFNGLWKVAPTPGDVQKEVHAAYRLGHWISKHEYNCSEAFMRDAKSYNS
jgi:hypothetical protein